MTTYTMGKCVTYELSHRCHSSPKYIYTVHGMGQYSYYYHMYTLNLKDGSKSLHRSHSRSITGIPPHHVYFPFIRGSLASPLLLPLHSQTYSPCDGQCRTGYCVEFIFDYDGAHESGVEAKDGDSRSNQASRVDRV